jgi:hypothetical protein
MRRIFSRMGCSRGSKGACTAGESAMFESCIEDEERTERAGRYCFLNGRSVRRNKVIKDVQDRREAYHQFAQICCVSEPAPHNPPSHFAIHDLYPIPLPQLQSPTTTKLLPPPTRDRRSNMSNAELATSYAALILADDGVDITVRAPHTERKQ